MFLSIITFGLYSPIAKLRLYHYFINRTKSNETEAGQLHFGYEPEGKEDYLYVFGQTILSIITLGIYYPWAFCNIGQRIAGKTFIEKRVLFQ